MNALDLALVAGAALTAGWVVFLLRRRRGRGRLERLSRHRSASLTRRRRRPARARLAGMLVDRPLATVAAGGAVCGGAGLLAGGPVAGVCAAAYAVVGLLAGRRHLARRATDRAIADLLDAIDDTVGDLRAGVTQSAGGLSDALHRPGAAFAGPPARTDATPSSGSRSRADGSARRGRAGRGGWLRLRHDTVVSVAVARLEAAQRVGEALGIPLADLLDRVDADLRDVQALRLDLTAQTSGAQATSALLTGMPLAAVWIGTGMGADPLGQLLHTPLGAACAVTAVALQCAGMAWTGRMVRTAVAEVR